MKIVFFLIICLLAWGQPSSEELKELESDAIVFGNGPNRAYVFIDPLCHNSQNYMDFIVYSDALQKQNTYYVFLHRLDKFESDELIDSIYMAENPKDALLRSMLTHEDIEVHKASKNVISMRSRISAIAHKTPMTRRPYLLIYNAKSNVCKVSEGTAPCMVKK